MPDDAKPTDPAKNQAPATAGDNAGIKNAVPAGKGELLESKQLTFSQHLFIWSMILVVGVLFGAGATLPLIQQKPAKVGQEEQGDVIARKQVAERLERAINAEGLRYGQYLFAIPEWNWTGRQVNAFEEYARQLTESRVAESEGLSPKGAALDAAVTRFLDTKAPGGKRTYREALAEHANGREGVTFDEVRRFVQEREARDALRARGVVPAPVPLAAAADMARMGRPDRFSGDMAGGDDAEVVEVVLSAERMLAEVADNDPEIAPTYERLKAERFTRKASAMVRVAAADPDTIAATIAVSDEDVAKAYDAAKETYRKPAAPDAKPDAAPEYQLLMEVAPQIKARLQRERAEARCRELIDAFMAKADEQGLDAKDAAAFDAAAKTAGLTSEIASVEEPQRGMLTIGPRQVKDVLRLFDAERSAGFVSRPVQSQSKGWLVLRLDSRSSAGFLTQAEALPQVKRVLAGRRAYAALLEQAKAAQAAAQAQGLKAWAASDAAKPWNAGPIVSTMPLTRNLAAPASEQGGPAGTRFLVASLALAARPVALAAGAPGDVPTVKLVQVTALKPAAAVEPARRQGQAELYQAVVTSWRRDQFAKELDAKVEAR